MNINLLLVGSVFKNLKFYVLYCSYSTAIFSQHSVNIQSTIFFFEKEKRRGTFYFFLIILF